MLGELALPEQGVTENTQLTNLGPKNDISVAAESQILSARGVTDADLVLLQIREGLHRVVHQPVPAFLCAFVGRLY